MKEMIINLVNKQHEISMSRYHDWCKTDWKRRSNHYSCFLFPIRGLGYRRQKKNILWIFPTRIKYCQYSQYRARPDIIQEICQSIWWGYYIWIKNKWRNNFFCFASVNLKITCLHHNNIVKKCILYVHKT